MPRASQCETSPPTAPVASHVIFLLPLAPSASSHASARRRQFLGPIEALDLIQRDSSVVFQRPLGCTTPPRPCSLLSPRRGTALSPQQAHRCGQRDCPAIHGCVGDEDPVLA